MSEVLPTPQNPDTVKLFHKQIWRLESSPRLVIKDSGVILSANSGMLSILMMKAEDGIGKEILYAVDIEDGQVKKCEVKRTTEEMEYLGEPTGDKSFPPEFTSRLSSELINEGRAFKEKAIALTQSELDGLIHYLSGV